MSDIKLPFYRRSIFSTEQLSFKKDFQKYIVWVKDNEGELKKYPEPVWLEAGKRGFISPAGRGLSPLHSIIIAEEIFRAGIPDFGLFLHNEIASPYIMGEGAEKIREALLKKMVEGRMRLALALTEPEAGSDLAAIKTSYKTSGDRFEIEGTKTFVSNGMIAQGFIVAARQEGTSGPHGVSLFFIPMGDRIERRPLKVSGLGGLGLARITFKKADVDASHMIGKQGQGFRTIIKHLAWERFIVAVTAMAGAETILAKTVAYAKGRHTFGKALSERQSIRFKLAGAVAKTCAYRAYIDSLIQKVVDGGSIDEEAEIVKLAATTHQLEIASELKQVWGGEGMMDDNPLALLFRNAEAQVIYTGSSEMMKTAIAKKWDI
ncbi:hypothetical protein MNBD_NITROSPINAE02-1091 [hydrothermal vent metagenome]|uniref:Acyl-CoA dehydrogenase n=1 Tax=hydrothermal vent metagenome TaxID=652676 RepID=A0A3B1BVT2_9ZZZZ